MNHSGSFLAYKKRRRVFEVWALSLSNVLVKELVGLLTMDASCFEGVFDCRRWGLVWRAFCASAKATTIRRSPADHTSPGSVHTFAIVCSISGIQVFRYSGILCITNITAFTT